MMARNTEQNNCGIISLMYKVTNANIKEWAKNYDGRN